MFSARPSRFRRCRCAHGVVDEALQELGGGDRAAVARAGVLHVGELRIDLLVVFGAERHAPDLLPGLDADFAQAFRQLVIVGEQAGMFGAEGYHDRTRQRGEIDHEFGLELFGDVPEHVGQHQAAFGVGVDDLDGLPDIEVTMSPGAGRCHQACSRRADGTDRVWPCAPRAPSGRRRKPRPHVALHVLHVAAP
jgi:hypothetical protein